MALDRLQLARQGVYRSYDADIMSNVQSALVERGQRWQDCSAVSQLCAGLSCDVSEIQDLTVDRVFARQLTAYKLVLLHQSFTGHTDFVSYVNRGVKFTLGHKIVSSYGFTVAVSAEDAVQFAGHETVANREMVLGILRVVVSGVGIRLGNQYVFPEMIPVAVAYLWQ